MSGITKTIPKTTDLRTVNSLYDGSRKKYEFHMAGTPSQLNIGDYVYTIYNDMLIGRLKIQKFIGGAVNPKSGNPRTIIEVATPGERLLKPIRKKGHRGTRYYNGKDWS